MGTERLALGVVLFVLGCQKADPTMGATNVDAPSGPRPTAAPRQPSTPEPELSTRDRQASTPVPPVALMAIAHAAFCPTSGRVSAVGATLMHVDAGGMRGVVAGDDGASAEIAFTYAGPSAVTTPLGDGTIRRQIGLKLRGQDTCNAIYIMWHIEPTHDVAVSVKRNPGMQTHAQCLDRGYLNLRPASGTQPAPVQAGQRRTLRASIEGTTLRVLADGVLAWEGVLPAQGGEIAGPSGVRSDNGAFDFEVRVPGGGAAQARCDGVVRD